jgi:ATPase family associated with various cellular activities (AAA)
MSTALPKDYPLYETVYGSEIPTEQYFVILFDKLPSKYVNNLFYDPKIIEEVLLNDGFVQEIEIFSSNRRYDLSAQSLYVNKVKQIMVRVYGNTSKDKDPLIQLDFAYNIKNGKLDTQFSMDKLKGFERPKKKANIQLVKSEMGHMDTEEYDLFVPPMDLELNYGSDFSKVHDVIVKKLNENNGKGIILLHGDPGTGKTSYIKHLTTLVKEKDILFIPPSMAEMLSEPTIIPFLMDHKNSVLIIEDAERVISDREGNGSPAGVSNILNLTDGILGDCLSIQIVATFNMKREKIDQALLRKGRLIAEHKFGKLDVNDTNKLLKHLKKDHEVSEGMTLADIYNIDVELFKATNKSKIGF